MSVVLETLRSIFPDDVLSTELLLGQAVSRIRPGSLLKVAKFLKDDPRTRMEMLVDITALDRPEMPERFEVVYSFYSLSLNHRLRLKVSLSAGGGATSLSALWPIADWLEREVWDMFGIRFEGHPGLKRLFLYEEFVGHPLRKDYPLKKRQPLIGPAN